MSTKTLNIKDLARRAAMLLLLLVTAATAWAQSGNYSVEMASGTHDASHWSFSSNTANFGNTITVNYSGYLNLQSVTLRRKTTNTYELNSSNISTAVSNFNSQSGSRLVFTANISEQQTFTCTEGEIDMNGHSSSKDLFIQNNVLGKTITIKNGTVTGTDGAGGFNDYYNGTVVLENMTVTGRVWTDGHPYVINGGTYAEIINDINANTPGTVTIYDGKFSQLGNWGSGGTFTLYGGKYAINPSSLAYCTIPSGYSVQSNTDSDSSTYPWVVRNTSSPVANPYSLAVTEVTANRQWTFTMPPYDVEVVVNYALSYLAYNTATGGFDAHPVPNNITAVTSGPTTMNSGWYIVNSNVTISTRITVNGTVNLILADGYSLTASQGITVNSGNTLNIYGQTSGTGALNATGAKLGGDGTEAAGIGSTNNSTVGNITIHGGRITANSAGWTAGIGGGIRGGGGSITIYGGTINATGHGSTSEGIGHGADGANVTKNLAEGLCVIVNNYSIPVAYGDRVSSLSQLVVRVEPCTEHNLSNNVCTYCGLSSYGVTYNSNNATSGTVPANAYYVSGQTVTVPGNTGNLERMGYTFGGWNTKANGSGTTYAEGETFAITGTLTLYAKWVASQLELANNADNGDAVSLASGDGMYYDVTLAGRTLYTDGDWNTLCLPFDVDDFTGTPLEGAAVKTLESSSFSDGTLTITFSDNLTSIDAGKPYIVKYDADLVIRTASDWNTFAQNVTNGTTYQGKLVKLAADISVSTMVGEDGNEFKGTFDGYGHTLTFNYTTDADNAAPFQWIKNAVIKNLKVIGEIRSSKMFAAGFVARAHGDNAIENCVSGVTIHATKVGDGTHGGFVGRIESDCKTFTFTDCKFNGTFDGSNTDNWCPFAAWSMGNDNTHFTFNNCLYAPASTNVRGGCATFYRNGTATLNGAYYTQTIGTAQGTNASGMSNETLASNLGDGWEISNGQVVPKMENSIADIVAPVFSNVLISDATNNVETQYADFIGTYTYMGFTAEDRSILFLGAKNTLYYPQSGAHLGACRAYFRLKGLVAGDIKEARMYFEEDSSEATIISPAEIKEIAERADAAWYTLDGRKLNGQPSKPGLYIYKGKKVKR